MAEIDPITLEVVNAAIMSVVGEMNRTIFRTGYSVVIRESWDASCGVLAADGKLVDMGVVHPLHMGVFEPSLEGVLREYSSTEIKEGDVFIINHPYLGGGCHASDVVAITPVFVENELVAWVCNTAHKTDLGGLVPGSMSAHAKEVYHESILIPPVKLYSAREPREDIFRLISANSRTPELVCGDLRGQVGTNYIGERGIKRVCERFGKNVVKTCFARVIEYTEKRFRAEISKWPDGTHEAANYLDPGFGRDQIKLHVAITIKGDDILFDFSGTDDQLEAPLNARPSLIRAAVWFACIALVDPQLPVNHGIIEAVRVKFRKGSIFDADFPAACGYYAGSLWAISDAILAALGKFVPEKAVACSGSTVSVLSLAATKAGKNFLNYDILESGSPGRPMKDGEAAIGGGIANLRIGPVEIIETEFLTRCRIIGLAMDSGGPGKYRGGLGLVREYQCFENTRFMLRADRHKIRAWGIFGGGEGRPGSCTLNPGKEKEEILPPRVTDRMLRPGDIIRVITPGGGGWGDHLERDVNRVLDDVLDGYVSIQSARDDYGVVINGESLEIDSKATERLRRRKR